eukprot:1787061-Rhodomonas_salina.4
MDFANCFLPLELPGYPRYSLTWDGGEFDMGRWRIAHPPGSTVVPRVPVGFSKGAQSKSVPSEIIRKYY